MSYHEALWSLRRVSTAVSRYTFFSLFLARATVCPSSRTPSVPYHLQQPPPKLPCDRDGVHRRHGKVHPYRSTQISFYALSSARRGFVIRFRRYLFSDNSEETFRRTRHLRSLLYLILRYRQSRQDKNTVSLPLAKGTRVNLFLRLFPRIHSFFLHSTTTLRDALASMTAIRAILGRVTLRYRSTPRVHPHPLAAPRIRPSPLPSLRRRFDGRISPAERSRFLTVKHAGAGIIYPLVLDRYVKVGTLNSAQPTTS